MTKVEYQEMLARHEKIMENYFLMQREQAVPRCVNCEHCNNGICGLHGEIPESYMYDKTECGDFLDEIPF